LFFFQRYRVPRALLSFPTRRSSDLFVALAFRLLALCAVRADHEQRVAILAARCALDVDLIALLESERRMQRIARVPAVRVGSLRSEEHTSELQSRENLVCRLLLEKK